MSNTVKEKFEELAKLVKEKFSTETETPEATNTTAQFAEVTLADGVTVLSYEGDLAVGTAIFVVGEDGTQAPAPEGTHELGGEMAGTSIVVDAEGIVAEVVEAGETEEEVSEEMSTEKVEAILEEKMSSMLSPIEAIAKGVEAVLEENNKLKTELENLKGEFEAFKAKPSVENETKKKFSRKEELSGREKYLLNLRKNK